MVLTWILERRAESGIASDIGQSAARDNGCAALLGFVRLFLRAVFLALGENHFPGRFQPR